MLRDDTDTQAISGINTGGKNWGLHSMLCQEKTLLTTNKTTIGSKRQTKAKCGVMCFSKISLPWVNKFQNVCI